jgi:ribosomal protein S18 acetylase RimI-like enzyme
MKQSDIDEIMRIHRESFPDYRSSKLGEPFLYRMYQWYVLFHPHLAFVAVLDEKIVGFVTGAAGNAGRTRYTFWHILWGLLSHPGLLLETEIREGWQSHVRQLVSRKREQHQLDRIQAVRFKITLDSIAVAPDARRKGVAMELVKAFERAATKQGATLLGLGVESNNVGARRFYELCGWQLAYDDAPHNAAGYRKTIGN